jgi:UDP-N-acetylmuramate-alanine ligase
MGAPRAVTFGAGGDFAADLCEDDGSHLGLKLAGKFSIARARVRAAGRFNAANATAALAAAQLIGATLTPGLLEEFPGVRRRQTLLSSAGDIAIVEDYAHHPAEIRALLESLRGRVASGGRLIVAFQPHRFSRTAQFKAEFARALGLADRVLLLDVYAAGEAPLDGGTAGDLHRELLATGRKSPAITYHPKADTGTISTLSTEVHRGDVVAFVGAGDIDRKAREWLAQWSNLP